MIDLANVDWSLLREQKLWLLTHDNPHAAGLVHLLDSIQDHAVNNGSASEIEVFGNLSQEN